MYVRIKQERIRSGEWGREKEEGSERKIGWVWGLE